MNTEERQVHDGYMGVDVIALIENAPPRGVTMGYVVRRLEERWLGSRSHNDFHASVCFALEEYGKRLPDGNWVRKKP